MAGREDSLKAEFDTLFMSACEHYGTIDVRAPLNGLDRFFNADTLFSTFDRFFIVEFKSYMHSLGDEKYKDSACDICCGLVADPDVIPFHDQCHFAMWGRIKRKENRLEGDYQIYRKAVCRPVVLPECTGASFSNNSIEFQHFKSLAKKAGQNTAGLPSFEFQIYLAWLLGNRGIGANGKGDFNTAIYATSKSHGIAGMAFKSRSDLHQWSTGARPAKRNDDWDSFSAS